MERSERCLCGSRKLYSNCCRRFIETFPCAGMNPKDTFLKGWVQDYGRANARTFMGRTRTHVFRISCLLQSFLDRYMPPPIAQTETGWEAIDEPVRWIEHGTLLSIFGSLTLLQEGLFIQSGILLRSVMENCFVLADIRANRDQMDLLMGNKYSAGKVVNRTKRLLPECMREWYGYFSRNLAHFGPLHPAPFMPTKCWKDNWVIVVGFQNIVRASVAFGIVLERLHYDGSLSPVFWRQDSSAQALLFDDDAPVWTWIEQLGNDIVATYPPGEKEAGFLYSDKGYQLKLQKPSRDRTQQT